MSSHLTKNNNELIIRSSVWSYLSEIIPSFCVGMLPWMRHGFTTTLQRPIDNRPSGLVAMNLLQSGEKRNNQLARLWRQFFWDSQGIIFIDYLEKGKTINSEYYIKLLERLKDEIATKRPHLKKKKLFHQENAPCHKSVKTKARNSRIRLWIASPRSVFPRSGSQRLFPFFRSQKDARWE